MKPEHAIATAFCAGVLFLSGGAAYAAAISGQGTWESSLQGRDLDGDFSNGAEAYYDTVQNITWLADANYAMTSGYDADGRIAWSTANAWAASLNPYGSGITGWRLPTTVDVGNDGATYVNYYQGVDYGYNITVHSEMSHMFYETLGNTAWYDANGTPTGCAAPDYCLSNTGPFSSVQSFSYYWSATGYAPYYTGAWVFGMGSGFQTGYSKASSLYPYAWAVHTGDVGAAVVPLPAAAWLFGSGLMSLLGVSRRRMSREA